MSARSMGGSTLELAAMALAISAIAGAAQAADPPAGLYKCAFFGYSGGVEISSIGNLHILGANAYQLDVPNGVALKTLVSRGTFKVSPFRRQDEYAKLTFAGGVLGGHWGYANRKPNGDMAIIFPNNEAEKAFDPGSTWCYYQAK